jgi:hypothetical protein
MHRGGLSLKFRINLLQEVSLTKEGETHITEEELEKSNTTPRTQRSFVLGHCLFSGPILIPLQVFSASTFFSHKEGI